MRERGAHSRGARTGGAAHPGRVAGPQAAADAAALLPRPPGQGVSLVIYLQSAVFPNMKGPWHWRRWQVRPPGWATAVPR